MEQISFYNYEQKLKGIDLSKLPQLLQEGHHFFKEAKAYYHQENTVKEAIDLYLKRLNIQLGLDKKPKTPQTAAIQFIHQFIKMHDRTISKFAIGQYVLGLQEAIKQKQITKTSPVASHIEEIQQKLIQQYNKLAEDTTVKIVINTDWLEKLNTLNGKQITILDGFRVNDQNEDSTSSQIKSHDTNQLFESINNISVNTNENTFQLGDGFGSFLGNLERFELAITIEGEQGSGKTRFTYQLANAFANLDYRIAIFSLEIGSKSDLIRRMKEDYLEEENQAHVFIADTLLNGIKSIKEASRQFDVVIIDSWNKVGVSSLDFDSLRKEFPDTIFIVIFQRTTQKTIRGGTAPLYDAGINIEVVKADDSFKNNYAVTTKNRYGVTGIQYNIYEQKVLQENNSAITEANNPPVFEI